jgi:hypothetical protein
MMGQPLTVTLERLQHELDHYAVFHRNGIPVEFHLFVGKDESTDSIVDALSVRPNFPQDTSAQERLRIIREAIGAPIDPSEHDLRWL